MRDPRNVLILCLTAGLAFCVGALVSGGPQPVWAQQASGGGGGGTVDNNGQYIAATGSVGSGMSVLWLVDTKKQRLLIYGTSNLGKTLELRAARNIRYDMELETYRDESQYSPEDLEKLWKRRGGTPPVRKEDVPPPPPGEDK